MDAPNQDSTTRDEDEGIARRVKDYCDKAVTNLKTGRFKEVYLFAREALELDEEDEKATVLYRRALYALHPKKRLLDKAETLHEEADRCIAEKDYDKAFELLSLAKKLHCTPSVLLAVSDLNWGRDRLDLAYLDVTEALGMCKRDMKPFANCQILYLRYLGYKVVPTRELEQQPINEMPARYHVSNWPKGLRIKGLYIRLQLGYARAVMTNGATLKPCIPLDQLTQFLNDHVQGAVENMGFHGGAELLLRLLDEVTVPGRLHVVLLIFDDFFRLPWAGIERILEGRSLRAKAIGFTRLQLPSGVDPNQLLKLPVVRECMDLHFLLYEANLHQLPGPTPLFNNAPLMEWLKRSDGRKLELTRGYLSSGLLGFLDTLMKDFQQATQMHYYMVRVHCPHMDVVDGLGVQDNKLSNRLGERMEISVEEHPGATEVMGHRFETVFVDRLAPSDD